MDSLLITINDIKQYKAMADMPISRIDSYTREAQMNDLKPFLGLPLYQDIQDNPSTANNIALISGGVKYTDPYSNTQVDFNGLKPMLVYFTLARIVSGSQNNLTSYGFVKKVVDQSEIVPLAEVKATMTDLRSLALSYQNEAENYLNARISTYPLFRFARQERKNVSGINFFKL